VEKSSVESEKRTYCKCYDRYRWGGFEVVLEGKNKYVCEKIIPAPNSPRWALSMMQRKILTGTAPAITVSPTRKGGKLVYPKS
jgi:hypothetical protein